MYRTNSVAFFLLLLRGRPTRMDPAPPSSKLTNIALGMVGPPSGWVKTCPVPHMQRGKQRRTF